MVTLFSHIKRFYALYWYCFFVAGCFIFLGWLFFWRLTYFNMFVFDEVYYAEAAIQLYQDKDDPNFQHPILAKWLISVPFYLIPPTYAIAWRIAPVVFGLSGLVVMYVFARYIGLSWWMALVGVFMLVGSKGYFTLSRLAMLDIFLIFFVLIASLFLYLYLVKNNFRRNYDSYSSEYYLFLFGLFTGFAGACKLSGFFVFLQLTGLYLFYFTGSVRRRLIHYVFILCVSFYTFFGINYFLYDRDFHIPIIRMWEQLVFHNSAMLPQNVQQNTDSEVASLVGGWAGLYAFFFQNKVYLSTIPIFLPYGYMNNPALAGLFFGFSLLMLLSIIGYVVRVVQRIQFQVPVMLKDKTLLFLYSSAFVHIVTWGFFERVSYIYYFVVAFPFILLMTLYYLNYYMPKKYLWIFLLCYFALFGYQVNYLFPF